MAIQIGDLVRHKGYASQTYLVDRDYIWNGERRVVGYYRHAPNQKVAIDMPESELARVSRQGLWDKYGNLLEGRDEKWGAA